MNRTRTFTTAIALAVTAFSVSAQECRNGV
ncbi:hypothetical protein SAMN04488026_107122 [Aliiruegeria lutimaris]|uniref:Uncharacterized protein n=1 Tax=Aliiruegeria lutimaris TaxID=571298 RepID=A0A1G9I075_9RHOB|nr:hypothetical protein SAMN04488026_107122 [Aliiruegeria lutimaris]